MKGPNTIMLQVGDANAGESHADEAELWQHVGLASRPSPPTGSGANKEAAQAVMIRLSDYDVVLATRDTRFQDIYGNLRDGETCLYATGSDGKGQARTILKHDGSINLYTKLGNSPTGKGMGIFIDPNNDRISIVNSKGYGIIINEDGALVTAKDSALKLDGSGSASLIGKGRVQVDGGSIVLGAVAVPGVNNALTGPTGIAGIASTKVFIATA